MKRLMIISYNLRYCYFLLFFFSSFLYAQKNEILFKLDKSFDKLRSIEQDSYGFIWISTLKGVYKYDGYNYFFTSSKDIFQNESSKNTISTTLIDKNGNRWYSSYSGELVRFDKNNQFFSYIDVSKKDKNLRVICSFKSNEANVWMGDTNGTIYKYNNFTEKIDSITSVPYLNGFPQRINELVFTNSKQLWVSTSEGSLYNYSVHDSKLISINNNLNKGHELSMVVDHKGNIWVATELNGIFIYDPENASLNKIESTDLLLKNSKNPLFITIYCDKNGDIWAGTDGNGVYKIDTKTHKVTHFNHDKTNSFSLNSNTVTNIFEDSFSNMWFLGKKNEISVLATQNSNINYYNGLENNRPTSILSILKSSDGSLWLGTDGEGINRVFSNNKKIQYDFSKKGVQHFNGRYILKLLEDSKSNIWISTYQNGIWVFNPSLNKFSQIQLPNADVKYNIIDGILFKDSKNRIWTTFKGEKDFSKNIYVFSENQKLLASFNYNSNGLSGKGLSDISQDEFGTIWFAVNKGGLFSLSENKNDLNKSIFNKHNFISEESKLQEHHFIRAIHPNNAGDLYLITSSGIFLKYNIKENSFVSFKNNINFNNLSLKSLLLEDKNNLWFSSVDEVHHYNLISDEMISFSHTDGLQNTNYRLNTAFKDNNGALFFGGKFGVDSFFPSKISKKEVKANLFISEIEILNKPAKTIIPEQFNARIEEIKNIQLNSNQSSFSFSFSAISNNLYSKFFYEYRLKGFDQEWVVPREKGVATYTNIPHGNYTFEVKAGTKNKVWNIDPIRINIYIKPPWWLSIYAYIAYFLIFILLTYGLFVWLKLKSKMHKEALKFNSEKELYELKMNFFAKMSHEIQTPLTLILGPISNMLKPENLNGNSLLKSRLLMIKNNANRLSRIALELMVLRDKELKKIRIYASENNLVEHLKIIASSFNEQAKFKNINFILKFSSDSIIVWYDTDKIEHVFYNLLSNAFKFTPRNGSVTLKVTLNSSDKKVEISVKDTGPGIPENELDHIFKFLYQSNLGKHSKGTGIGLSLAKELIELHHGSIFVSSTKETGTNFIVQLSTNKNLFKTDEKVFVEASQMHVNTPVIDLKISENKHLIPEKTVYKTHHLLIVEDNVDMQIFLQNILNEKYNLSIATNGEEGICLIKKNIPDLIISDIIMPVMDGIQMCNILKSKKHTSQIPIIFLSAENTLKSKIVGLKSGAVEYLNKPFNVNELLLKVNNIISTNDNIISKCKIDQLSTLTSDTHTSSKDEMFIKKLTENLNKHMYDQDFKLECLSKLMNLSYSVFYRNCFEITGKSPINLVKKLKIKRAALLIIKEGYSISEAAYMIGYKDAKYFSKSFKEEFGKSPSAIKNESKKLGLDKILKKYMLKE